MREKDVATAAELTFLRHYCAVEETSWGWRVLWDAGGDWPKFNFVKIADHQVDAADLSRIVASELERWPANKTFSLRFSGALSETLPLLECGLAILSYRIDVGVRRVSKHLAPDEFSVVEARDSADKAAWIVANSEGRSWTHPELIYGPVTDTSKSDFRLWSLKNRQGETTATIASQEFCCGHNLTLLSVKPTCRRQGCMRSFFDLLQPVLAGPWYVQVNEGEAVQNFLQGSDSATCVQIDRRYVLLSA